MTRAGRLVASILFVMISAGGAHAADRAVLENVKTEWQNAYGAIIYTVLATVKNTSDAPIQSVSVKVELFDKNGTLVAERLGHNVGAEVLDDETGGSAADKLARVKPIAARGTDLMRLSLDKADIGKPFRTTHVSIVEIR